MQLRHTVAHRRAAVEDSLHDRHIVAAVAEDIVQADPVNIHISFLLSHTVAPSQCLRTYPCVSDCK